MEICTSEFEDDQIMLNSQKHFEASSTMADYFHGENAGYDFDTELLEKSLNSTPNVCDNDLSHINTPNACDNDLSHINKADQDVTVASACFGKKSKLGSSHTAPATDKDKQARNEDGQASHEKRDGQGHASSGVSKPSKIDLQNESDANFGLTVSVISGVAETGMPLGLSVNESNSQILLLEKDSDSHLELTVEGGNLLEGKSYNSETAYAGLTKDVRCSSRQYYEISQHIGEPDAIMKAYSHFHYSKESSLRSHSLGPADHVNIEKDNQVDRLSESVINEESSVELEGHDSYSLFISTTAEIEIPSSITDTTKEKPGQNFLQHPGSLEELIWGCRSLSATGSQKEDRGTNENSNMLHPLTKSISEEEDSELLADSKEGSIVFPSDCIVLTSCDQERKIDEAGAVLTPENINLTSYDKKEPCSHFAVTSGFDEDNIDFDTHKLRGNMHSEILNAHWQFADSCLTFAGGSVTVELGAADERMHLVQLESSGRMSFQAKGPSLPTTSQSFVGHLSTANVPTEDQESVAQVAKVNVADIVEKSGTVDIQLHSVKETDSLQNITETLNHVPSCTVSQQLVRMPTDKFQQKPFVEVGDESTGFSLVKEKMDEQGNLTVEPLGTRIRPYKDKSQPVHDLSEVLRQQGLIVSGELDKSVQVTAIQLLADVLPTHDIPSIADRCSMQQEIESTRKSTDIIVMEHDDKLLQNSVLQSNWFGKNERTECGNEPCVLTEFELAAAGPQGEKELLGVGLIRDSLDNVNNTATLHDTVKLPQVFCAPVGCSTTVHINEDLATQVDMILEGAGGSVRLKDEGSLSETCLSTETFMLLPPEAHSMDDKEKIKSTQQLNRKSRNQKADFADDTEGEPLVLDDNVTLDENELHVAIETPSLETQSNLVGTSTELETSSSMDCDLRTDREIGNKVCDTCPEFSAEYKDRVPASLEEKNAIFNIVRSQSVNGTHDPIINQYKEVPNTEEDGHCKLVGSDQAGTKLSEDVSVIQCNEDGEVGTKLSEDVSVVQCNEETLQPSHSEKTSFSGHDGPSADITDSNQVSQSGTPMSQAMCFPSEESLRDEQVQSFELSMQSSNSPQVSTNNEVQQLHQKASACLDSSSCILPLKATRKPTSLSDIKEALNTHRPVTEMQKVQLHSQIRVYGALLQGVLPEESHMAGAFAANSPGLHRGKKHIVNQERSVWGKAWQKAATKTQGIKSNHKTCPSEHSSSTMHAIPLNTFVLPTGIGKTSSKATHSIGSIHPIVDLTLQSAITSPVGSMRLKNVVSTNAIDNIGFGTGLAPTIGSKQRSSTSTLNSLVSAAATINSSFLQMATVQSLQPPLTPWHFSAGPYVAGSHTMNFPSVLGPGSCWVSSSYSSTATPLTEPMSGTLHPAPLYTFTQAIKDVPPHIANTNPQLMLPMPSFDFEHVTSTSDIHKGRASKARLVESKSGRSKRCGSEPSSTVEMLNFRETSAIVQGMVEMAPHVEPSKLSCEIACTKPADGSQGVGLAVKPLKLSLETCGKTSLSEISHVLEKEMKYLDIPMSSTGLSFASNMTNVTPLGASRSEISPLAGPFEGVSYPDEIIDNSTLSIKLAVARSKPSVVRRQIPTSEVGLTVAESYNRQGAHQTVTDSAAISPAFSTCVSLALPLEVPEDSLPAREVVPVVKSIGQQGSKSLPEDEIDHSVASGEQPSSFQAAMGKLEEAKLLAKNTKSAAISALEWSRQLWNRSNNQGMVEHDCFKESEFAVFSATIDAAISAVRAAGAAGKVAYEAVTLAKCLLDDLLEQGSIATLGGSMNENITENVETLAANILCSIELAKQASADRVVAASLASKKAQILDAVVQAADLAAKAASQAGAIITLGETSPFSLQSLQGGGLEATVSSPMIANKRSKGSNFLESNSSSKKETVHHPTNSDFDDANIEVSPRESELRKSHSKTRRKIKDTSRKAKGLHESKAGRDQKIQTQIKGSQLTSTINHIASVGSEIVGRDFEFNPAEVEQDKRGRMEIDIFSEQDIHLCGAENIRKGVAIEVVQEANGVRDGWFKAKVLSVKGNKVLVVYDELYDSDEDCQLEEWVPLPNSEDDPPRIRLLKEDGIRRRRRATIHNQMWVMGDHVEVLINDGWWRGVVQSVNEDDERHVTVIIPGGEAVAMKSWNLRPCLTWKEGSWVPQTVSKDALEIQEAEGQKLKVQRLSSYKANNQSSNERKHGVEAIVSSKEKPGEDGSLENSKKNLTTTTSDMNPFNMEKATVGMPTATRKRKSMVQIIEIQGNTGATHRPTQQNFGAGKRTRNGLRSEQAKRPRKTKMNVVRARDRDEVNIDGKEDELPVIMRLEKLVNLKSYKRRNPNVGTREVGRTQASSHDKPTRLSKLVLKKHPENFGHLPFRGFRASM